MNKTSSGDRTLQTAWGIFSRWGRVRPWFTYECWYCGDGGLFGSPWARRAALQEHSECCARDAAEADQSTADWAGLQ